MEPEIKLNDSDRELLAFCRNRHYSVNDISRHLNIAPSSVVAKIMKLKDLLLIEKQGKGKKTFVRTREGIKTKKYIVEALQILKAKGEMKSIDFDRIFPLYEAINNPEGYDKLQAIPNIRYSYPPLIETTIKLTPEGLKFLKENGGQRG